MFTECPVCVRHRACCWEVSSDLILVTPPMRGWWYPSFMDKETEAEAGWEAHSRSHGRREKPEVCRGLWFPDAVPRPPRAPSHENVGYRRCVGPPGEWSAERSGGRLLGSHRPSCTLFCPHNLLRPTLACIHRIRKWSSQLMTKKRHHVMLFLDEPGLNGSLEPRF